jgi:hypothetical protein
MSNSSETESFSALDLRKKAAKNDGAGVNAESLSTTDARIVRLLARLKMNYDPTHANNLPENVEDTYLYELLLNLVENQTAMRYAKNGNISGMKAIAGSQYDNNDIDTNAWQAAHVLTDILWEPSDRDAMLNMIVYGPSNTISGSSNTGAGKTDFSYSVVDGGRKAYARVGKTLQVCTNNTSDPFKTVEKWSEAHEWMTGTDGPKVLLLDEAAQGLMYSDMTAGKVLGKVMNLMRKYNCHLILIAHDGKDIALNIRRKAVFARKEGKKKAILGNKLDEDDSGEVHIKNVEYTLENVPATEIEYDSIDDKGAFEWDIDEDDDDDESVEKVPQCQAETNSGNPCPNDAKLPEDDPLVCVNHRHKVDEVGN